MKEKCPQCGGKGLPYKCETCGKVLKLDVATPSVQKNNSVIPVWYRTNYWSAENSTFNKQGLEDAISLLLTVRNLGFINSSVVLQNTNYRESLCLAFTIANYYTLKNRLVNTTVSSNLIALKRNWMKDKMEAYQQMNTDLLIITILDDDLDYDYALQLFERILFKRSTLGRPTILITNLDTDKLVDCGVNFNVEDNYLFNPLLLKGGDFSCLD